MANYQLSHKQSERISVQAMRLCDRRINTARMDFPLTIEQVQEATVPAPALQWLRELENLGVETVRKTDRIYACTPDGLDGIPRRATLEIKVKNLLFFMHERHRYGGVGLTAAGRLQLDLSGVPQETVDALATWVNGVVRECRLKVLVDNVVKQFAGAQYMTAKIVLPLSTYSIQARWPMLGMLLIEDDRSTWQPRMNDTPKPSAMGRWQFNSEWASASDNEWYAKNKKLMDAVDVVLSGAMMMPNPVLPKELHVSVEQWVKLPGDSF